MGEAMAKQIIQTGINKFFLSPLGLDELEVKFPEEFTSIPKVFCTIIAPDRNENYPAIMTTILHVVSEVGFTCRITRASNTGVGLAGQTVQLQWMAIVE